MLSDGFKDRFHCCNPDGSYQIGPYIEWWNTVEEARVLDARTNRRGAGTSQVEVTIRYYKTDGTVVENTHTYNLIANPSGTSWLFE